MAAVDGGRRTAALVVVVAVGLAFADASVVALALPDLYAELDTTIVGVSWVLTTYALAVALTALPLAVLRERVRPRSVLVAGIAVFVVASVAAGAASSLAALLVARAVQGVGATLLLAGSLPVLEALVPGPRGGRRWWALAGAVGAATGPVLGGVLTEVFTWRAIFLVQAPVVAAALVVARVPAPIPVPAAPAAPAPPAAVGAAGAAGRGRRLAVAGLANAGFALVFAALVAVLFLGVLLAIEVWRYSPLQGAALVSSLLVGMLAGRALHGAGGPWSAVRGAVLLAAGLGALALIPGEQATMAAVAFALCGAGFDLVHEALDAAALPPEGATLRRGAVTVGARHAGLVLGLALIAPVLSTSLEDGIDTATLSATGTMLESELSLADKIPITWALRTAIEEAPKGQVPDLAAEFDARGARGSNPMARARDDLADAVGDAVTRAFRPAFTIAAALALAAAVPAAVAARRRRAPGGRATALGVVALTAAAVALVGAELSAGARDVGEHAEADPCTAPADTYGGPGIDGTVQRIGLSALNGAACDLGTTRERLVLSLDPGSGYDDVRWDDETAEDALRVGAHRAIDDAVERDDLPGWAARALGFVVDRAPVGWLVERLPIPGG